MKRLPHLSVLPKFLIAYLLVVTATILLTLPVYQKSLEISKQNAVSNDYQLISERLNKFERSLTQFYQIPYILSGNASYQALKAHNTAKLPTKNYFSLLSIKKGLAGAVYWNETFYETFLVFNNNPVIITTRMVFPDNSTRFEDFFDYIASEEELRNSICQVDGLIEFLPLQPITFNDAAVTTVANAMTVLVHSQDRLAHVGEIIKEAQIKELFDLDQYGNQAFAYLEGVNGEIYYAEGREVDSTAISAIDLVSQQKIDNETFTLLRMPLDEIGLTARVGIPETYFLQVIRPVKNTVVLLIFLAAVIGAVISILLAQLNYRPIRQILRAPYLAGHPHKGMARDEFSYISNTLQTFSKENETLNQEILSLGTRLKDTLLFRALKGDIFTAGDRELVRKSLPNIENPFRIALLKIGNSAEENADMSRLLAETTLSHTGSDLFTVGQLDECRLAVLFSEKEAIHKIFQEAAATIHNNLQLLYQAELHIGISSSCQGIDAMHTAYDEARFALQDNDTSGQLLSFFHPPEGESPKILEYTTVQKLYELTLSGEYSSIQAMLDEFAAKLSQAAHPEQLEECACILRFILRSVCIDRRMDFDSLRIPMVTSDASPKAVFKAFEECFKQLCEEVSSTRLSGNQILKSKLIAYVSENCCDPNLYAAAAAEHFNISEKHLYRLVREQTGQSFGEYLEQLRIARAMELLRTSDMSVADISAACGFSSPNTFYRVFKKCCGVSPSSFRRP